MEKTEKIQIINIEAVKLLMKERGIDEKAMADKMVISPTRLRNLLSGVDQRHMHSDVIYKIANVLSVPLSAFLNL